MTTIERRNGNVQVHSSTCIKAPVGRLHDSVFVPRGDVLVQMVGDQGSPAPSAGLVIASVPRAVSGLPPEILRHCQPRPSLDVQTRLQPFYTSMSALPTILQMLRAFFNFYRDDDELKAATLWPDTSVITTRHLGLGNIWRSCLGTTTTSKYSGGTAVLSERPGTWSPPTPPSLHHP